MPSARDRKEMLVDKVRIAGARSADGGNEIASEGDVVEIVAHADIRTYGFRADCVFEINVEVRIDSERSLR